MARALDEILRDIKNLEPLPRVALRVMELGADEQVVPRDLIAVIETDAAMTAKVLRLSNSAYYGFRREIASLAEAGNLLGVSALVNLVLTSCAARYFRGHGRADARTLEATWERSISNALAASLLARVSGGVDQNRAYTAGLLQNIGEVVLDRFLAREALLVHAAIESGASRIEAERAVLGLDHAEVGARLCERWGFPDVLVDAVRFHHEPESSRCDPLLTCFVHLGEQLTMNLADALQPDAHGEPHALHRSALTMAGMDLEALEALTSVLGAEVEKAREFVEVC